MLSRDAARAILDDVLGRIEPHLDAELRFEGGLIASVEVRQGGVAEHTETQQLRLTLRLGEERSGIWAFAQAQTSRTDPQGLAALVERARSALRVADLDGTALAVPSSRDFAQSDGVEPAFDTVLLETGAAYRVHRLVDPLLVARRYSLTCDGRFRITLGGIDLDGNLEPFAVGNSRGVFQHLLVSRVQAMLRPRLPRNVPDYAGLLLAEGTHRAASDLDPALERYLRLLEPLLSIEPALQPPTLAADEVGLDAVSALILEPAATAALLEPVFAAFGATAIVRGTSPLAGVARGLQVFGEAVSLRCDVTHPLHSGVPFDHEGVPTRTVELIERGKLVGFVWGRRRAVVSSELPTGHTIDADSGIEAVRYPVMDGGDASDEAMLAAITDGLLVQRLLVRPTSQGDVAASPWQVLVIAPDGALRVRNGVVTGTVSPWQVELDLAAFLGEIAALGPVQRARGAVVPPVRFALQSPLALRRLGGAPWPLPPSPPPSLPAPLQTPPPGGTPR